MEMLIMLIVVAVVIDLYVKMERMRIEVYGSLISYKNEVDLQVMKCEQDNLVTLHLHKMRVLSKDESLKIKEILE